VWFRKSVPRQDPGTELGIDQDGQYGKTSKGRKWFSYDWWHGHHMARAADGSWATWDNMGKAPAGAKWGSTYTTAPSLKADPAKATAAARFSRQTEYTTHLHRLESEATTATNGFMVTPAGKAKGYRGSDFFAFSTANRPARRYATDELRAWMQDSDTASTDSKGGGLMSYREWERRKKDDRNNHTTIRRAKAK
jgi:hypothetical protein